MASPLPAASPHRKAFSLNRRSAVALSIALHAALLYMATRVSWTTTEVENTRNPEVIWLRDWPLEAPRALEPARSPDEAPRSSPPESAEESTPHTDAVEPAPRTASAAEPDEDSGDSAAPEPRAPSEANSPTKPQPAIEAPDLPDESAASNDERGSEALLPEIDWEAERQRAAEQIVAEIERERRFRTFSLADVVDEAPEEDEEPLEHLFDASGGGRSRGPSLASVGHARTKVGRALIGLCNALTGGFSIMGFFRICAEDDIGSYAASPLRPDYLKKLPVCTDTAAADDLPGVGQIPVAAADGAVDRGGADDAVDQAGTNALTPAGNAAAPTHAAAATTIKCRLLGEQERAAYWKLVAEQRERRLRETETAADAR